MKKLYITLLLTACSALPVLAADVTYAQMDSDINNKILQVINSNRRDSIFRKVDDLVHEGKSKNAHYQPSSKLIHALIVRAIDFEPESRFDQALITDTNTTLQSLIADGTTVSEADLYLAEDNLDPEYPVYKDILDTLKSAQYF